MRCCPLTQHPFAPGTGNETVDVMALSARSPNIGSLRWPFRVCRSPQTFSARIRKRWVPSHEQEVCAFSDSITVQSLLAILMLSYARHTNTHTLSLYVYIYTQIVYFLLCTTYCVLCTAYSMYGIILLSHYTLYTMCYVVLLYSMSVFHTLQKILHQALPTICYRHVLQTCALDATR